MKRISNSNDFKELTKIVGEKEYCFKLPVWQPVEISETEQIIQTREGPQIAHIGSAIITGVEKERWPVPENKLDKYDFTEKDGQKYISKKLDLVEQIETNESLEVSLSWTKDPLIAQKGDKIIQYGIDDFGVVGEEIFNKSYENLSEAIIKIKNNKDTQMLEYIEILMKNPKNKETITSAIKIFQEKEKMHSVSKKR